MFFRIMIVANFPTMPPVDYLREIRDYMLANALTINPGQDISEISFYQFHRCFHDIDPSQPCETIDEWGTPE